MLVSTIIITSTLRCGHDAWCFLRKWQGRSLPIFCIFIKWKKSCTGQSYKAVKAQNKKDSKSQVFSFHTNRASAIHFLGLIQIWPSSSLRDALHSSRVAVWLSKIIPFLVFQRTQHAVIKISLMMWLLKSILAWMIMSSGWRLKFQTILIEFQQSELKGHSKRDGNKFLQDHCGIGHYYSLPDTCFFFSGGS